MGKVYHLSSYDNFFFIKNVSLLTKACLQRSYTCFKDERENSVVRCIHIYITDYLKSLDDYVCSKALHTSGYFSSFLVGIVVQKLSASPPKIFSQETWHTNAETRPLWVKLHYSDAWWSPCFHGYNDGGGEMMWRRGRGERYSVGRARRLAALDKKRNRVHSWCKKKMNSVRL